MISLSSKRVLQSGPNSWYFTIGNISENKKLENQCGVQLITRTSPPHLTDYGQKLAGLLYHVNIFEHDVLNLDANKSIVTIPIAVNSDTLATWLIPALCVFKKSIYKTGYKSG